MKKISILALAASLYFSACLPEIKVENLRLKPNNENVARDSSFVPEPVSEGTLDIKISQNGDAVSRTTIGVRGNSWKFENPPGVQGLSKHTICLQNFVLADRPEGSNEWHGYKVQPPDSEKLDFNVCFTLASRGQNVAASERNPGTPTALKTGKYVYMSDSSLMDKNITGAFINQSGQRLDFNWQHTYGSVDIDSVEQVAKGRIAISGSINLEDNDRKAAGRFKISGWPAAEKRQ